MTNGKRTGSEREMEKYYVTGNEREKVTGKGYEKALGKGFGKRSGWWCLAGRVGLSGCPFMCLPL